MSKTKLILAFTGQMASGKGTVCDFFNDKYKAETVRFSTMLRDILDRLYMTQSRENMQNISLVIRENFGQDIMAKVVAHDVESSDAELVVVDGVRRPADIQHLKKIPGFNLIAIEVPAEIRYERLTQRRENPDDASKTWQEFVNQEQADADKLVPDIMKEAGFVIDNSGTLEELYQQLEELYTKIKNESQG